MFSKHPYMRALTLKQTHRGKLAPQTHLRFQILPSLPPALCFETPLRCLHGFNQPQDSQGCIVGCIYTAVSPPSIHIRLHSALRGGEVLQKGMKRKTRSDMEITVFQYGLMLGHESTPFPREAFCKTLSGFTEPVRKLTCSGEKRLM